MATAHLAYSADSPPDAVFRSPERPAVASYEREPANHGYMDIRLREALAREAALRRQVDKFIQQQEVLSRLFASPADAANRVARLTTRERQIMELVLAGHPSKNIAADLGIAIRTVENHRASIMEKTGSRSLPALVRFALAATWNGLDA